MIELPYNFNLRPYQLEAFEAHFKEDINRLLLIWHRRAGKTKMILNFLIAAAMQRVGVYYHAFPTREQAKKNIWDGIDKDGRKYLDHIPEQLIKAPNSTDLKIELINGSILRLVGMDKYDSLVGGNPVGIVFDEYAIMNPSSWDYMRPIFAENDGWAAFVTTTRGKNHLYDMYLQVKNLKNWFVSIKTIDDTKDWDGIPIIEEDIVEEERRAGMPEERIQQEFYCSFEGGIQGAYYSDQIQYLYANGRIKDVKVNPLLPVYTFWDVGFTDATTIWFFQQDGSDLNFIDYYEENGSTYDENVAYIELFARTYKVRYGAHFGPHDLRNKTKNSKGKNALDICAALGLHFRLAPTHTIQDGIQLCRGLLPQCYFDHERCKKGLRALQEYHKKYDEVRRMFTDKPVHNWASHGADGYRIFAVCHHHGLGKLQQGKLPTSMRVSI